MSWKKNRNKGFGMPCAFGYQEFAVDFVERHMEALLNPPQGQTEIPNFQGFLDAIAKRLQKTKCETPAQMKHVAEQLKKLGYATDLPQIEASYAYYM